jgi:hypothetical protein
VHQKHLDTFSTFFLNLSSFVLEPIYDLGYNDVRLCYRWLFGLPAQRPARVPYFITPSDKKSRLTGGFFVRAARITPALVISPSTDLKR